MIAMQVQIHLQNLENKIEEIFGKKYFLPAHQGRACENIISQSFVTEGSIIPMNYHFTTTKSHIVVKWWSS